jgi:PAS domain S-box-containing protein
VARHSDRPIFESGGVDPRLNQLFDAALDAVIGMNAKGRVIAWNRQAEVIFGWAATEAMGAPLGQLIVPPERRRAHNQGVKRFLATRETRILNQRIEIEACRRDGDTFPCELTIIPLEDNGGIVFYAFLRNIEARRAMESALKRRAVEAQILFESAMLVSGGGGADQMFRAVLRSICETVGWQYGHLYLVDETAGQIVPTPVWHPENAALAAQTEEYRFRRGTGMPGRVWQTGEPEFIGDLRQADLPRRELMLAQGISSAFAFPVFVDGRVHAVLEFFSTEERRLDDNEVWLVRTLGLQLGRVVERRQAAEQQRLLLRELSHRTHNLMAITASIFRQSARHATTLRELAETFPARLESLATASGVLAEGGWRSAPLGTLISEILAPFGSGPRIRLVGPELHLDGHEVMALSLVFHELATNAVKYGALHGEAGEVSVAWKVEEASGGGRVLALDWVERGGPPVAEPTRKGFGTTLLESLVARRQGSTVRTVFDPEGLRAHLWLAIDNHETKSATANLV